MRKLFVLLVAAIGLTSYTFIPAISTPANADPVEKKSFKGSLTKENFQDSVQSLYNHLQLKKAGLTYEAFKYGMIGYHNLKKSGKLGDRNLFTIIDFTQPSTSKRFYTIDFDQLRVIYQSYVAHGRKTGENMATAFSNVAHSNQSSLGFYITGETYTGSKGYSLKLDGVEDAFNGNLRDRAVVIHEADYVSEYWIKRYGRLGRSQGCPALPKELSRKIIDTIKNKTAIFAYYNHSDYLKTSTYLDINRLANAFGEQSVVKQTIVGR